MWCDALLVASRALTSCGGSGRGEHILYSILKSEEIKNETITIIEKSALGQPVNIGDLGEKSGEGRSSSSSHKKSIGCDTLTLPLRSYFDRFKKSKEYDDKAAYDCRNMLSNNFKPKLIK